MSYIAPDGDIVILKNIPLDMGYNNTISFASEAEQIAYFLTPSRVKATLTRQSYSRVERGIIRAQVFQNDEGVNGADYYRDCNYLAFTNHTTLGGQGYSHKWYYAFITGIYYVNNTVAEIHFTLDVMQTWMFNYTLKPSFVEREHTDSDKIGEHVLPEPLDATQYCMEELQMQSSIGWSKHSPQLEFFTGGWSVVVWATFNKSYQDYTGQISGALFNGLCAIVFTGENKDALARQVNTWIQGAVEEGKEDGIVAVNMFPTQFLPYIASGIYDSTQMSSVMQTRTVTVQRVPSWGVSAGIRNNKLYTYPYTMLTAQNHAGDTLHYRYEWFDSSSQIKFYLRCALAPTAQADISATNYNGSNGLNLAERLTITSFPQCAYNTDAYKAWMAQNSVSIGISTVSSILGAATSAFTAGQMITGGTSMLGSTFHQNLNTGRTSDTASGYNPAANPMQAANRAIASGFANSFINAGTTIANNANAMRLASIQPPVAKGSASNVLDVAYGRFGFYLYQTHLTYEAAKAVDDYFTRYGYTCNRVKVPNRRVRDRWTYTKTAGCNAIPNTNNGLPADDLAQICNIYDKGITFWKYRDDMDLGNYDMTNDCVSSTEQFIIVSPSYLTVEPGKFISVSATVGENHLEKELVKWEIFYPDAYFSDLTWDPNTGTSTITIEIDEEAVDGTFTITAKNTIDDRKTGTCVVTVKKAVTPTADVAITSPIVAVSCVCGYTTNVRAVVTLSAPGDSSVTWSLRSTGTSGTTVTSGVTLTPLTPVPDDFNPLVTNVSCAVACNTWALPGDYVLTCTSNLDKNVKKEFNLKISSNTMASFTVMKSTFETFATPVRNADNKIAYWYWILTDDKYNMAYGRIGTGDTGAYAWAKLRESTTKGVINDPALVDGTTQDCVIVRPIDNNATDNARACVYITHHLVDNLSSDAVSGEEERITLSYPKGFNMT